MLSRFLVPVAVAALVLAEGGGAQSAVVWPAAYANRAGEEAMGTPFSISAGYSVNKTRSMTVIVGSSLPFGPGSVINQIAFRRDSKYTNQTYRAYSGGSLVVEIGYTLHDANNPDAAFYTNWKEPPTTVFVGNFNLPQSAPPSGAAPFALSVPFQLPWTYWGGNIAIDMLYDNPSPPTVWRRDAMSLPAQVNGTYMDLGGGCQGTNGLVPRAYPFVETCVPGRVMVMQLYGMTRPSHPFAPETVAFNWLGSNDSNWGTVGLPFDLGNMGFPSGCMLKTDIVALQTALTQNPSFLYTRSYALWELPNEYSLVGTRLYSQWICPDFALATDMKFTTSNAVAITLGTPDPQPREFIGRTIWLQGASGSVQDCGRLSRDEYAPIIRFTGSLK